MEEEKDQVRKEATAKSRKKTGSGPVRTAILVLLVLVMLYSGYRLAAILIRDGKAKKEYQDIQESFVKVVTTEAVPSGEAAPTDKEPVPSTAKPAETAASSSEKTAETAQSTKAEQGSAAPTAASIPASTAAPVSSAVPTEAPTEPAEPEAPYDPYALVPLSDLAVDFDALRAMNGDVVGWLQGMGDSLSYPVAQGEDNDYYLNHFLDGSYNGNGTLFVDSRNDFMADDVTYIYGHHMQSGAMFGELQNYDYQPFFIANPYFMLYTPERDYKLAVYTVIYGDGTEPVIRNYLSEEGFNAAMAGYAARSQHNPNIDVHYGDKLVCLCTCAYHQNDGRYFVLCKVIE